MKLGAFIHLPGHHLVGWRHPQTEIKRMLKLSYLTELAQLAERAKFDNIFLADNFGEPIQEQVPSGLKLDPVIILAALSAVTENIGLVATYTTTYNEPFQVARKLAAIDHLSNGRAAWNLVTSNNQAESLLFGKEQHLRHDLRYERAGEFVEILKRLWFSIDEEALVLDKENAKFYNLDKVNFVQYEGDHFQIKGALDAPSTPQGHPVIVQAGSSMDGRELAAKHAEVVFTAWNNLEEAQAYYKDVKGRLSKYGRQPEDLVIMPGTSIIVGETEKEAKEKHEQLKNYITPEIGLYYLSRYDITGLDLMDRDLDDPIPDFFSHPTDDTNPRSRANVIRTLIKQRELKTLRDLCEAVAGARGHRELVGTPIQIADEMQKWFENGAADGYNVMAPTFPQGLTDIIEMVIPELQNRGLFRTEYEGTTLRENLGLKRPKNPYLKKVSVK